MENLIDNFIVFEGICGGGKTTAARSLCKLTDFIYNKGSLSKSDIGLKLKEVSIKLNYNFADSLYISDLIIQTTNIIKPLINSNKTLIQDRYIDSVIAYSRAFARFLNDDKYDINFLTNYLEEMNIFLKPKRYFYFYASKKSLIERIKFNPTPIHNMYLNNPTLIDLILEEFEIILDKRKNQNIEIFRVDTDKLSLEEVLLFINTSIY